MTPEEELVEHTMARALELPVEIKKYLLASVQHDFECCMCCARTSLRGLFTSIGLPDPYETSLEEIAEKAEELWGDST